MTTSGIPVFATAFRVFFLAAAIDAVSVILLWLLHLRGIVSLPTGVSPVFWHTYEMVFGFSRAAIFGFLFTAGQHWSGKQLLTPQKLAILFVLWVAGRFSFFMAPGLAIAGFAIDSFVNVFALWQMRPLLNPQQKHNHSVVYLFVIFSLAQAFSSATTMRSEYNYLFLPILKTALLSVIFLIAVIAGRVLPFFASVVIAGKKPRILPWLEKLVWPHALLTLTAFALAPAHSLFTHIAAVVCLAGAVLHGARWLLWRPQASWRMPILSILFLGYLFLVAGFAMLASSHWAMTSPSAAWHMMGIGAIAIFVFGMMTRVALGHTGRPIKAGPLVVFAYTTITAALFARVVMPMLALTSEAYLVAATLWLIAFSLYLFKYTTILWRPRADGRPG